LTREDVQALDQSSLYAAEGARRAEDNSNYYSTPLSCGRGATTTTRGSTPSQEKDTSSPSTRHAVNEDSTPTAAATGQKETIHSTTVSAARVSTILSNHFRGWNSTPQPRGDNIPTHVRVDTDTDEPHRNINITDSGWLHFSLPWTIKDGVWSDTSGFYVVRHGNVTKPGFIHDMLFHTRLCQLFQAYCPDDVTVRFISTNDAHSRRNLARVETFAKLCLYSQGRDVDGKIRSCYSGHSEVYLNVGLPECNETIAAVLTLLTSEDDFDPIEGGHDLLPITRENWARHQLMRKFLYSAALNARSRHTSCEFAVGDVNNEGWAFTRRWRVYCHTWHMSCPCMLAATPAQIRKIFRKVLDDEEVGKIDGFEEDGGRRPGDDGGDKHDEEGGGSDGEEVGDQHIGSLVPGIVGIPNPHNLCYINSAAQVLFSFPIFIKNLAKQHSERYSMVKTMP
jgi:hypothetical protein